MINLIRKSETKIKSGTGFTIIELLVVLSIIGLLAGLAITQLSAAQQKARDVRRMSDVREIKKALTLYQVDNISFPVVTATSTMITGDDYLSSELKNAGAITQVPIDPRHPVTFYTYQSNSTGTDYDITFCLETDTIPNYSQGCVNTNTIKP